MKILTQTHDKTIIFQLQGQLSVDTCEQLLTAVKQDAASKYQIILLDAEHLDYVSSAGIRVLYQILAFCQDQQQTLALINLQPNVAKVFKMIELEKDIPCFENKETALANLEQ